MPFTPARMTRTQKTVARVGEGVGADTPLHWLVEIRKGTVTWNTQLFLIKSDIHLPCTPAVLILDNNPRKVKTSIRRLADKCSWQLCPSYSQLETT